MSETNVEAEVKSNTVEVHFKSLVTGERVSFPMDENSTLGQAWDQAYTRLEEQRRDGDTLQCAGSEEGRSLMGDLNLTLSQARQQRICGEEALRYEIKGPSGGAES